MPTSRSKNLSDGGALLIVWVVAIGLLLAGCESFMRVTGAGSEKGETVQEQEAIEKQLLEERELRLKLHQRHEALDKSLTQQVALGRDLEGKLARLNMQLLEKEAQIEDFSQRLEEAILEVVRAKAKLRSLGSKAEAASNLAEAEIALKALESKFSGIKQDRKYLRAHELLRLCAKEFKGQNYGGALYLSSQAKSLIRESQERTMGRQDLAMLPGEVPFALPVQLRAQDRSNLRYEPSLNSKVVAKLGQGEPLIGHSYKGKWVRVQDESGHVGWVFYELVSAR